MSSSASRSTLTRWPTLVIVTLHCIIGLYSAQDHALAGVTKHLHRTMEAFLDEVFGPIQDYFEDDYFLAAAKLVEEYGMGEGGKV